MDGTEQFLYEIAKKYYMYDITIFYDQADEFQLKRLKKIVRCKKRTPGEIVKCKKAFFNFNTDMIDEIEAEEYYFVSHANYEELHRVHGGYIPPINSPKLTHYIGVSQFATDKLNEYAEKIDSKIKAKRCYNPLTLEPKEKVMIFVSAARLDDKVKGGTRIQKMIEACDRYCNETGRHYLWLIFSNPNIKATLKSKNIAIMPSRVDVRPYISMADYIIHLPNDMETYCYTDNEALGYGIPIVTTPLSILKELPITDNERIVLEYDCSNIDDVVKQMFEKKVKTFSYNPPEDEWEDYLDKTKSYYEEEIEMRYLVEALPIYEENQIRDNELGRIPKTGEQWIVTNERKNILTGDNTHNKVFVKVIEEVKEEQKQNKEEIKQEKEIKETPKPKRRKKVLED